VKGSAAVTMSETTITRTQPDHIRRVTGLCGVAGALLFFGGDMLFYGYFGAGSSFADGMRTTVAQASTQRLFAGGLIGPIAACLCIVGFWHVYLNVRPSSELFRRVMLAAFFILMVGGSAVHTLWTAEGLALKYCYGQGPPCSDLLTIIKSYWTVAYNLTSIPGYFGSLLLMGLVVTRRTWYPRWTVLVNPGVLILLSPVAAKMPSPPRCRPRRRLSQSIHRPFFPDIRRLDMGAPHGSLKVLTKCCHLDWRARRSHLGLSQGLELSVL
jgi:hypothetical protein